MRKAMAAPWFLVVAISLVAVACQPAAAPATPTATARPAVQPTATLGPPLPTSTPLPPGVPSPTPRPPTPTPLPPTATPAGVVPQYGGVLHLILPGEPAHHDPHRSNWPHAYTQTLETLLRRNLDTGEPECELCESWAYTNPTTLVFKIRQGVKFHNIAPVNSREMTADDVLVSLNDVMDPKVNSPWRARFASVDSARVVDKYTLEMKLKAANASFIYTMPGYPTVYPKEILQAGLDFKDPNKKIGTGAFIAGPYQPGVGGTVKKNPDYWQKGKPYLDAIDLTLITDQTTLLAATRTGRLDIGGSLTGGLSNVQQVRDLRRTNPDIGVYPIPDSYVIFLNMQLAKKPFDDKRVRKALFLALDRQEMVNVIFGGTEGGGVSGPMYWRLFPEWTWSEQELLKLPGYRQPKDADRAEAKRLLAEAGYPSGIKLDAEACECFAFINMDAMVAAKSQLAPLGIDITIKIVDQTQWFGQDTSGDFFFRSRGIATALDPIDQLFTRHHTKGTRNFQKYSNPEVDKLLDEAAVTVDASKRKPLIKRAQEILMDDVPIMWLYVRHGFSLQQPWIKAHPPTVYGAEQSSNIWIDPVVKAKYVR